MPTKAENFEVVKKATQISDLDLYLADIHKVRYVLVGVVSFSIILGFCLIVILKHTAGGIL